MTIDALPASIDAAGASRGNVQEPLPILLSTVAGGLMIWLEHQADGTVVHLEGALDLAGGVELGATIEQIRTRDRGSITMDATALSFIDLSGYRALHACVAPQTPRPGDAVAQGDAHPALLVGATVERLRHLVALAGCRLDGDAPEGQIGAVHHR